jgi:predicted nucleic acid-binding protein
VVWSLSRAVEIATQARIGIYDCLYVALAEQEHCELVTADQRLISSLGTQFPIVSLDSI